MAMEPVLVLATVWVMEPVRARAMAQSMARLVGIN